MLKYFSGTSLFSTGVAVEPKEKRPQNGLKLLLSRRLLQKYHLHSLLLHLFLKTLLPKTCLPRPYYSLNKVPKACKTSLHRLATIKALI